MVGIFNGIFIVILDFTAAEYGCGDAAPGIGRQHGRVRHLIHSQASAVSRSEDAQGSNIDVLIDSEIDTLTMIYVYYIYICICLLHKYIYICICICI